MASVLFIRWRMRKERRKNVPNDIIILHFFQQRDLSDRSRWYSFILCFQPDLFQCDDFTSFSVAWTILKISIPHGISVGGRVERKGKERTTTPYVPVEEYRREGGRERGRRDGRRKVSKLFLINTRCSSSDACNRLFYSYWLPREVLEWSGVKWE